MLICVYIISVEDGLLCYSNIFGGGYVFVVVFIWYRDGYGYVGICYDLDVVVYG